MNSAVVVLKENIPEWERVIKQFPERKIPVLSMFPSAVVKDADGEHICYVTDKLRLTLPQIWVLSNALEHKYRHQGMTFTQASSEVLNGMPIAQEWVKEVQIGEATLIPMMEDIPDLLLADEEAHQVDEAETPDLGTCCQCGTEGATVRHIITLKSLAPVPGTGWGCMGCNLPEDGAMAVLCDECMDGNLDIKEVVCGTLAEKKRVSIDSLSDETFDHDYSLHGDEF